MLCGNHMLHWDDFVVGVILLTTSETLNFSQTSRAKIYDQSDALSNIQSIKKWRFSYQCIPEMLTCESLFNSGCKFGATDLRDHVFALVGLMEQRSTWIQYHPDYTKDRDVAFEDFTRHLFSRTQQLDWLDPAGRAPHNSSETRPSWVLDYSKSIGFPSENSKFKCSGSTNVIANWIQEDVKSILQVSTYQLDTIAEVTSFCHADSQASDRHFAQILVDWCGLAASATAYGNQEGSIDAFWRTCMLDHSQNGEHPAPSSLLNYYAEYAKDRRSLLQADPDDKGRFDARCWVAILYQLIPNTERSQSENEEHRRFGKLPKFAWFQRLTSNMRKEHHSTETSSESPKDYTFLDYKMKEFRFFVSERGYMGLCRESAQKGDEIHVMSGSNVPFVLRARIIGGAACAARHFTVHGQAYIHGFMDGEALEREDFQWNEAHIE